MKRTRSVAAVVGLCVLAGGVVVLWLALPRSKAVGEQEQANHAAAGSEAKEAKEAKEPKEGKEAKEVVAKVQVARAHEGTIEATLHAYGAVVATPEDVQTVSVPFESRVRRVGVVAGAAVGEGAGLVEIEPSPDALLALSDARTTRQAAERDLAQVQQRMDVKLATKTELSTAQQALQLATSKLESMEKRGIEAKRLTSPASGLVGKINVQEGQIVAANTAMVEIVRASRMQIRLGVEPAKAAKLKPGMAVHLEAVQGDRRHADGTLKVITQRVNPTSRLVDVYVAPTGDAALMLDTFISGRIVIESRRALLVPRSAVLSEEDKRIVFTVADGKAVEHEVTVGLQDQDNIELVGGDVKAGDVVVIAGNAELEPGMAVEVEEEHEPATRNAAQTAPATENATTETAP